MAARPTADQWSRLSGAHDTRCVDVLRPLLEDDGLVELTDESLAQRAGSATPEARALLEELERLTVIVRRQRRRCGRCDEALTEEEAADDQCVHCGQPFTDCPVVSTDVFVREASRGRDVPWILVLHGMATAGEWQEELSWLCATTYQRSLPVFIYKCGKVRPGVFLCWRQRQLARKLARKLEYLTEKHGMGDNGPDVVAHSFGTWLIGHVLQQNPSLKVGRLILAGSILRPDFDWDPLLGGGQVQAILNHCAGRDKWVPLAHLVIPDAGPSGTKGFFHRSVVHRDEREFGHSTFFEDAEMEENYRSVWDVFLKRPTERINELQVGASVTYWSPLPIVARELFRWVLLIAAVALALLLAVSTIIGLSVVIA